jgi:PAS domain S-box-containing protein
MRYNTAHLHSLFENATEGIILTNGQGQIILVNPAAERMFRYSADELSGKPIETLIPQRSADHHKSLREGFYSNPGNRVMGHGRDLYGRRKDDTEIPVEVSLSSYKMNDELYVIAFIVDITYRKTIENDMRLQQKQLEKMAGDMRRLNTQLEAKVEERTLILKEALQKLEQSQFDLNAALNKEKQLNEIKSSFVSLASHEFRTPLSTVLSSAVLIGKYTLTAEQANRDRHIKRIKDSVKQLNDLLEDFLSLGKLEEGKIRVDPEPVQVQSFVEDTSDELKAIMKAGQVIDLEVAGHRPFVTDKRLLKNVLINLLSNAVKFSPENAAISVRATIRGNQLILAVSDNGIGISDEDQRHMFTSFYRGKNALNIQGTGLGLHIVKRYVDLLEGTIALKSQLDVGTTVTVTLTEPTITKQS